MYSRTLINTQLSNPVRFPGRIVSRCKDVDDFLFFLKCWQQLAYLIIHSAHFKRDRKSARLTEWLDYQIFLTFPGGELNCTVKKNLHTHFHYSAATTQGDAHLLHTDNLKKKNSCQFN